MIAALATARLSLQPLAAAHAPLYCGLYTDPQLMRHVGASLTAEQALHGFARELAGAAAASPRRALWAIGEHGAGVPCGLLALVRDRTAPQQAQIGALLQADRHGRGYAAEAIAALVVHAFDTLDVEQLYTRHAVANRAAGGLMAKLGFVGRPLGAALRWELLRTDWPACRARFDALVAADPVRVRAAHGSTQA